MVCATGRQRAEGRTMRSAPGKRLSRRAARATHAARAFLRGAWPALIAAGLLAAGCAGPGAGTPRPTDPHAILAAAVRATAALPSARFHAEITSSMGAPAGGDFGASTARI